MGTAKEVLERSLAAWRARDTNAFVQCFAEDAVITAPGGVKLRGADGARQLMSVWTEAMPDNEIETEHEHVAGPVVVQEATFRGTHTGNLALPDGQAIPATRRSTETGYAAVAVTEGDRIVAFRLYFDQLALLTQLGLVPTPGAPVLGN
jgi:uncharacterized protein (TIGR02246 family)